MEKLSDNSFHGRGEDEIDALFVQGDGAEAGGHVRDELTVVANASG